MRARRRPRCPWLRRDDGRMATAICFDADFPEFIRQAGQGSADLLIVPANEWKEIKDVHAQMAAFRAIENGVPLVRPAASGISSAHRSVGPRAGCGGLFCSRRWNADVAQVPVGGIRTLYPATAICLRGCGRRPRRESGRRSTLAREHFRRRP